WACLDTLNRLMSVDLRPAYYPAEEIRRAIDTAYQQRENQAESLIGDLEEPSLSDEINQLASREDLLDDNGRAPMIRVVNALLFEAVRAAASDVHIQPYGDGTSIRFRVDGILSDTLTLPRAAHEGLVSRVKIMGRMNIAEKRLPQDGRASVSVGDRVIDLRVSTVPTNYGERIVLRLLDKGARRYTLDELGMDARSHSLFSRLIQAEHGLILVTGPTGSGKSTTLYGALNQINSAQLNVLTLEDPIEYELRGISQMQVSDKKGMTFAKGLRSVLRQDPDIIMVGEIRDRETAELAIQAALTGHLVFSTLHTNDSSSAVTRLLDLGIEPYLVSSSLLGIMAQRLVRRVCRDCGEDSPWPAESMARLGVPPGGGSPPVFRTGAGCDRCRGTGYRGRLGVFEFLRINDAIRALIQRQASAAELKAAAKSTGMETLRDDGMDKIFRGLTTPDEVLRVTAEGV
ncbi:MAG: ATPase, T2SS/T4P/T4SS family, partial [Planctomycetota bacterium]